MENVIMWLAFASFVIFLALCTASTALKSRFLILMAGVFALITFSSLMYNSAIVKVLYIEDWPLWNIAVTVAFTAVLVTIVFGTIVWLVKNYQHKTTIKNAEKAGMTICEFTRWQEETYERVRQEVIEEYGYPDNYLVHMLYEEEEQKLFNKNKQ